MCIMVIRKTREYLHIIRSGYTCYLGVILISGLLLILIALYQETVNSAVTTWWRSGTFAHCFLVIPTSVYLIWRRRRLLKNLTPVPNLWGFLILSILVFAWLLGHVANIQILKQLSLVTMIPVLVLTLFGGPVVRTIAFPLGFLIFAVPMGESLIPGLINFTAWFTVKALYLLGVPVVFEGRFISILEGNFEVAKACSGLRYLISALVVGSLYAYLKYHSVWRRCTFIALAALVSILANGLRAFIIVMLAHLGSMRLAVGVDHFIYGWVFFGVVLLLLFWMGSRWREPRSEKDTQTSEVASPNLLLSTVPQHSTCGISRVVFVAATMLLILAGGPLVAHWLDRDMPYAANNYVLQAPPEVDGWSSQLEMHDDWQPQFQGADALMHRAYVHNGQRVHLFIAYYGQQHQGDELISSQNRLYDRKHWFHVSDQRRSISLAGDSVLSVHETYLRSSSGTRRLVWHWYRVGERATTNPYVVKLLEIINRLRGVDLGSALLAVASDYDLRADEARVILVEFLNTMAPFTLATLDTEG
jgi:exosortase A